MFVTDYAKTSNWLLLVMLATFTERFHAYFYIPGLPKKTSVQTGHINIGALLSISDYDYDTPCSKIVTNHVNIHFVEAILYAIHTINEDKNLLNGIKLGLVILDDCFKESVTMAQALRFVPTYDVYGYPCYSSATGCRTSTHAFRNTIAPDLVQSFNVVGVVGARRSSSSIAASLLLGPTRVPLISFTSTSDALSNKHLHANFFRVVPPDKYQARAMVDFVNEHGWTYISAIYEEGSYGELGYKNIEVLAEERGICIATAIKLRVNMDMLGYNKVLEQLLRYNNAKVVVSFGGFASAKGIFEAVQELKAEGKFIWIGSDSWSDVIHTYKSALGVFSMSFYSAEIPDFENHYSKATPNSSLNPWFRELWEDHFGCLIRAGTCDLQLRLSDETGFEMAPQASAAYDAVYAFGHALNGMFLKYCPGAIGHKAVHCANSHYAEFMSFIRNTSFEGTTGLIQFDEFGNRLGKYFIHQVALDEVTQKMGSVRIGVYDLNRGTIDKINPISWSHMNFSSNLPWPESVCSKPCRTNLGQFMIQKQPRCCWECRTCRSNEIIIYNGTQCKTCPKLSWPSEDDNRTRCLSINPYYFKRTSPMVLLASFFATLFILVSLFVIGFYIRKRDVRIIKASSKELSFLQLCAITAGYVTVLLFLVKPTHTVCQIGYLMFCLSFNALYASMFVKALRIHRIFKSGKTNKRPGFTSPRSQTLFSLMLISIQVVMCLVVSFLFNPSAVLTQPVRSEKFVELSCHLTTPGLSSFLAYNLLLVSMCSLLAFKTRGLPDNFNESRFVSMCVSTTLVIWIAFMPSYFTAVYRWVQTLLLILALLLNHNIALLFLFVPKMYAVLFPHVESKVVNRIRSRAQSMAQSRARSAAKSRKSTVAPVFTINSIAPSDPKMGVILPSPDIHRGIHSSEI